MDIRYNTIMYTEGKAIKLRGHPAIGMDVVRNVFAHQSAGDAMQQTVSGVGIRARDNIFAVHPNPMQSTQICDFDGDGLLDRFYATRETVWFASDQGQFGYRYLTDSRRPRTAFLVNDADLDGRCDLTVDGVLSRGGTGPVDSLTRTDILWQQANSGSLRVSLVDNGMVAAETFPGAVDGNRTVLGTADFDADGDEDILWQEAPHGRLLISFVQDGVIVSELVRGAMSMDEAWLVGIGHFDGDDIPDLLWRRANGKLEIWFESQGLNAVTPSWRNAAGVVGLDWHVKAVGDFNGDGYADIVWRHSSGQVSIWLMVGPVYTGEFYPGGQDPTLSWTIQGAGDFDGGDGCSDLLWRHKDGGLAIWFKGSDWTTAYPTWQNRPGWVTGQEWQIQGVSDFNRDGRSDILWRRTSDGLGSIWLMDGGYNIGEPPYLFHDTTWHMKGLLRVD
jgi:hypothetical protein